MILRRPTPNTIILPPLLDRMEVIRLSGYTEDEKVNISQKYLIPKQSVNNGLMRVTSDMYASSVGGHEDPFTNGGRAHGLEIDVTGCTGIGFCIGVSNQSAFEAVEFRAGADRDLSGIHFSGNGTSAMNYFMDLRASSRCNINTKVSRNSNTTIASGSVFDGQGYNTLTLDTYTETQSGSAVDEFSKLPGGVAYASGFTTPEDFSANATFGTDKATGPIATTALDTEVNYF